MSAYHATHQLARSACLKCLPNGCHICCEGVITQYISLPVAFTFSCCSIGVYYSALFAMEKGCAALFSNRVSDDWFLHSQFDISLPLSCVPPDTNQTRQLESEGNL